MTIWETSYAEYDLISELLLGKTKKAESETHHSMNQSNSQTQTETGRKFYSFIILIL